MDSISAFALGQANRGKKMMVFDWDKAATLIRESGAIEAYAGLRSDWEWTGGPIYLDGKPVPEEDTYVYLASTWAVPELDLDGGVVACYRMQDAVPKEWGTEYAHIYWPTSALRILKK